MPGVGSTLNSITRRGLNVSLYTAVLVYVPSKQMPSTDMGCEMQAGDACAVHLGSPF